MPFAGDRRKRIAPIFDQQRSLSSPYIHRTLLVRNKSASLFSRLACSCKTDIGIDTEADALFPAAKSVLEAPLPAGRHDFKVQAPSVAVAADSITRL